jgi:hypothetical protein
MKRAIHQNIQICNILKEKKKINEMNNKTVENIEMFKAVVSRALKTKIQMILRAKRTKKALIHHLNTRGCQLGKVNTMSHIMMVFIDFKINSVSKYLT